MEWTVTQLKNGNVWAEREVFDGIDGYTTQAHELTAVGAYVHQVTPIGTSQICEGLLPAGPTLMHHGDLLAAVKRTLS